MEQRQDTGRNDGDVSRSLGLKISPDPVFPFRDLWWKIHNVGAWRGVTSPPPQIYLPMRR
ncbi:hypothetical protein Bca101_097118 [Brassica carinata]